MRAGRDQQPLSYDVRLPDEAQTDALRLLDVSRQVVNAALVLLWPHLNAFMQERRGPAWKQVVALIDSPDAHGDRQWRCEAETAGRIMRAQAERKRVFQTIQPILTDGFIRPTEEHRPAAKNRTRIKEAITELQKSLEDNDTGFVTMQNVVEQCCNYYFAHECFPATYEDLQPLPRLVVGLLTFAGDDGGAQGQSYRFSVDQEAGTATLRFRFLDENGLWHWRKTPSVIKLPEIVKQRLKEGSQLAPTLREHTHSDGSRIAVLDVVVSVSKAALPPCEQIERVLGADWGVRTLLTATACDSVGQQVGHPFFLDTGGFDGRQARTRRQIDELKAKVAKLEVRRDSFPQGDRRREPSTRKLAVLRREIDRCWRKYELRNQTLAHLAANVLLLLLCAVHGCSLLCMESLKTLKSTGRGKGVRGRWRNYRNNSTIRGEIWRILRYKCHLAGIRFRSERPKDTSHTCPRCVTPVKGHHLSGEPSPTSSGNGSMPNVSLTPERRVRTRV